MIPPGALSESGATTGFGLLDGLSLLGGFGVGLLQFLTLRWNVALLASGRMLKGVFAQLLRLTCVTLLLCALARTGASAVLCGGLGLLAARQAVLRHFGASR